MNFISWHYSFGLHWYWVKLRNSLRSVNHQFSLPFLLPTLFSPWRKLSRVEKRPGFHPDQELADASFNFISRIIGALVRISLLIIGLTLLIVVFLGGVAGGVFWLLFPFLSYGIYSRFHSQPKEVVGKIINDLTNEKDSAKAIFNSSAGGFVATHLGVTPSDLIAVFPGKIDPKRSESFYELVKQISPLYSEKLAASLGFVLEDVLLASRWWDYRRGVKTAFEEEPVYESAGIGKTLVSGYTPNLDRVATDMASLTNFSHHLIGRAEVVVRMEQTLTSGRSVILSGAPGVGKKTVVHEFARRAVTGQLGDALSFKRILELDTTTILAGAKDISERKKRLSDLLSEAEYAGNIVLVIKNIERLLNSKLEGFDFTDIFSSHLESGRLMLIGIVDSNLYDQFIDSNQLIKKYSERIEVPEVTKEGALEILLIASREIEKKTGIIVTIPAIREAISSSDRYITDTPFPEKAIELLDTVVIDAKEKNLKSITPEEVKKALSQKTGIPSTILSESHKQKLSEIEDLIHKRLVNQHQATSLIGKILRSKSTGVVSSKRPVGSLLFLGPTGVGKTETAKALAEVYFGDENNLKVFNMAEYATAEGVDILLGSAVRSTPGLLTLQLSNHPASLVLFDELEKAPKEVVNLLLALLEEGQITDHTGKKVVATHSFFIATSNAGAEQIRQLVNAGKSGEELQKEIVDHVMSERIFSPELLNRFDGVVVYEPLSREHLIEVARRTVAKTILDPKNLGPSKITVDESVYEKIAKDGYEPSLGARPVRRLVELEVGDVLAKARLATKKKPWEFSGKITVSEGKFVFVEE
jgi:ATP-dependent Clp protease ATP-binding subunit ClpC